jgi:hypothetical protein
MTTNAARIKSRSYGGVGNLFDPSTTLLVCSQNAGMMASRRADRGKRNPTDPRKVIYAEIPPPQARVLRWSFPGCAMGA